MFKKDNSKKIFSFRKLAVGLCSVAISVLIQSGLGSVAADDISSDLSSYTVSISSDGRTLTDSTSDNSITSEVNDNDVEGNQTLDDASDTTVLTDDEGVTSDNQVSDDTSDVTVTTGGEAVASDNTSSTTMTSDDNTVEGQSQESVAPAVDNSELGSEGNLQSGGENKVADVENTAEGLNYITNPTFESEDYVSSKPSEIISRGYNTSSHKVVEEGNTFYKSNDNSTNDFILFGVATVPGKVYYADADIKINVDEGYSASGAFFDIKTITNGYQKTLSGGKGVAEMGESIGKWARQQLKFVADSDKTYIGLVKWNDDQSDKNTLHTTIEIDNLKVSEVTDYKEVWRDDFSDDKLNDSVWGYELGNIRGNEQQHYSSSKENVDVKDGKLVLTLTKRPEDDQYYNKEKHGESARLVQYNSGSVRTAGRKEFLYGRIEARVKLPKGKGVFPAFWTLGADFNLDGRIESGQGYNWPSAGEIDIMEMVGQEKGVGNRTIYGTPHFFYDKGDADKDGNAGSGYSSRVLMKKDLANDYHIVGINWSPDCIEWYIDGNVYNRLTYDSSERSQALKLAFNRPQFIQFNLAAGGNWPGDAGNDLAGQSFEIDWVKWSQNDEQRLAMEAYYKDKPVIEGVKNHYIVQGETPDLLGGMSVNLPNYKIEYSIDNEYMFVNTGAVNGRNEVGNVVENSSQSLKISKLKPGIYNVYYTAIPTSADYNSKGSPLYKITRKLSQLIILPKKLKGTVGATLSSVKLPDGWEWDNPNERISKNKSYNVTFKNPNDKINASHKRAYHTTISSDLIDTNVINDSYKPSSIQYNFSIFYGRMILDYSYYRSYQFVYGDINWGCYSLNYGFNRTHYIPRIVYAHQMLYASRIIDTRYHFFAHTMMARYYCRL